MLPEPLLRNTWTIPLVLAGLTGVGLVTALLDDGLADWIGVVCLAIPLLPVARACWPTRR